MMKKNIMLSLLFITAMLSLPPFARADMSLSRFETGSYETIVNRYQAESFLLVLWSLDCPPCIAELPAIGKFHQLHPEANIVMVSTDTKNQQADITQLMNKHRLTDIQQWVFDDNAIQALRFEIDPVWYGELPRSYFHHENKRQSRSGRLDETTLSTWIRSINNTTAGL